MEDTSIKAVVPERIIPHILASIGDSDDASMSDAENEISQTEFNLHANMIVVGKNAHIINPTGRKARVQPYSPN